MPSNRPLVLTSVVILVMATLSGTTSITTTSFTETTQKPQKILIAHRGASAYAPENTLPAFRLAVQMGADFVEYDLQVTKDQQLVCLHDETLERTTNVEAIFPLKSRTGTQNGVATQHWYVSDFTLKEIKQLDAGSWFGEQYKGTQVPTFQEAIDELRGKAGHLIELKKPDLYNTGRTDMERMVLATLRKNGLDQPGADPKTPIIIQSFSARSIQKLARQLKSKLRLHLLVGESDKDVWLTRAGLAKVKEFSTGISPAKSTLIATPEIVKWAQELGLMVTPYTFRASATADLQKLREEMSYHLFRLGVNGVITDNPDQMPRR